MSSDTIANEFNKFNCHTVVFIIDQIICLAINKTSHHFLTRRAKIISNNFKLFKIFKIIAYENDTHFTYLTHFFIGQISFFSLKLLSKKWG